MVIIIYQIELIVDRCAGRRSAFCFMIYESWYFSRRWSESDCDQCQAYIDVISWDLFSLFVYYNFSKTYRFVYPLCNLHQFWRCGRKKVFFIRKTNTFYFIKRLSVREVKNNQNYQLNKLDKYVFLFEVKDIRSMFLWFLNFSFCFCRFILRNSCTVRGVRIRLAFSLLN